MQDQQNKGYAHPYGHTVVPEMPFATGNGAQAQPAGAPSVIPGSIGVAGTKLTSSAEPSSSFGPLFDSFMEVLIERVADRVVEKLRLQPTMVVRDAPAPSAPAVLTPDYARTMAPEAIRSQDSKIPTAAADAHARLQDALRALPAFAEGKITFTRAAPAPIVFRVGGGPHEDPFTRGVEWTAYAAEYDNPRFPVKAVPGTYMVLVNGARIGIDRERLMAIETELTMLYDTLDNAESAVEAQQASARETALLAEKARLEANGGLSLEAIIERVVASI